MHPVLSRSFKKLAAKTTWEVLSSLTQNKKLIGVLTTQYGDYGLPPKQSSFGIHALVTQHYLNGAGYPVGESEQIALSIIPTIQKTGREVFVRAVGVRLVGGKEVRAATIISNVGIKNTYLKLLKQGNPIADDHASSVSHFGMYIGFKETFKNFQI